MTTILPLPNKTISLIPEILEDLVDSISKRMPKWIACENWTNISVDIDFAKKMLQTSQVNLKKEPVENFENAFIKELEKVVSFLKEKSKEELLPIIHDLESIQSDPPKIAKKIYDNLLLKERNEEIKNKIKKISSEKQNNYFTHFKKMVFYSFHKEESVENLEIKFEKSSISPDMWEYVAKKRLNELKEDFNFKSVSVLEEKSWIEIYSWANDVYKSIEEAQNHIGLDKSHAGLNKTINLCFNPNYLMENEANGAMFPHPTCNTIFLNAFDKNSQKCIWQHEYAHTIDNRLGINYFKSINYDIPKDGYLFLSQIEINKQLKKESFPSSNDSNISNAQNWLSESMSAAIGGSESKDLIQYHKKCSEKFLNILGTSFFISLLPENEKTWNKIRKIDQMKILESKETNEFLNKVAESFYLNPKFNLFQSLTVPSDDKKIAEDFKKICLQLSIASRINGLFFLNNSLKNIQSNEAQIKNEFKHIMNDHGYAHTSVTPYFASSLAAIASATKALIEEKPYWSRPIEIFARCCENLQQPLVSSSKTYFENLIANKTSSSDYINPILNLPERKLFIQTLHQMLQAIKINVNKNKEIKAFHKTLIKEDGQEVQKIEEIIGTQSYSTMSGTERKGNSIFKVALLRENNNNSMVKKYK